MTKDLLKIEITGFSFYFILACFAFYITIFTSTLWGGTILNDDTEKGSNFP